MNRVNWIVSGWLLLLATAHADVAADRINAAIPIPRAIQFSWMALSSMATIPRERRELENDFKTQLKIRGLGCAPLFSPSKSTSDKEIVSRLSGSSCMEKADATLAAWLGWRRVEFMLRMPPLRPELTSTPPLIAGAYIQEARFAPAAGVGLLWANQNLEIVDLQNGRRISNIKNMRSEWPGEFSPNGRLLTLSEPPGVALMDTETGEIVATVFSNLNQMFWLDKRVAMYADASGKGMMLIDFHTGIQQKIDFLQTPIMQMAALPQRPGEFIAFSQNSVMRLKVDSQGAEPEIKLLAESPFQFQNAFRYHGTLSSGGRYYISVSGDIAVTTTDTLDTEIIPLSPYSFSRATPFPQGDKFLLSGALPNSNSGLELFEYSISSHTLARVDPEKVSAKQVIYLPSSKSIACVSNDRILFMNDLPVQNPVKAIDFVALAKVDAKSKVAADVAKMGIHLSDLAQYPGREAELSLGASSATISITINGPIAALAKDSDIEAISIYQAENSETISRNLKLGVVRVNVNRNLKPIMLILSSYNSVNWKLEVQPGARISAILLSGHSASNVDGNGSARVISIGSAYGYQLGTPEYKELEREVVSWTGKTPNAFQGVYEGSKFNVGGNYPMQR